MRGTAYLIGSMQGSLGADLMDQALAALRSAGKERPRVVISYAALAADPEALAFMAARLPKLFPDADTARVVVDGEPGARRGDVAAARGMIEEADLILLSGGDPVVGARLLRESGAAAWLRAARARGAPCAGIAAGAILLGGWWASWPETAPPDAPFEGGTLIECTNAVADLVVDCHDEDGGWSELRLVGQMLAAQGESPRLLGIPAGGAVVVAHDGSLEVVGEEPFRL